METSERQHGLQRVKKMNKSLFSWFVDLQEEHFLLISLSRHRTSPTGLALSYNFPSCHSAEDGEESWKLILQLCKDSMEDVPWVLDLRLRWIQHDVEDFWPWAEGTVKQSESWKFREDVWFYLTRTDAPFQHWHDLSAGAVNRTVWMCCEAMLWAAQAGVTCEDWLVERAGLSQLGLLHQNTTDWVA